LSVIERELALQFSQILRHVREVNAEDHLAVCGAHHDVQAERRQGLQ